MSAITSTPAYLSAKARVAPGVSGARAAVARPAGTRRAFVVRASAEQKKGVRRSFSTLFAASGTTRRPRARRGHVRQARRRTRRPCERRGVPAIASSFRDLPAPSSDRADVIVFTATRRADDATRLSNRLPTGPPSP